MQIFIYCKATLHVSGVTAAIIRSIKNCNRSLRYRSDYLYRYSPPTWSDRDCVPIRPRWRGVAVPVPEAAVTVFNTPDDGCCDTRNMYRSSAVNKYLHTVAFLFTMNCDARNHELKKIVEVSYHISFVHDPTYTLQPLTDTPRPQITQTVPHTLPICRSVRSNTNDEPVAPSISRIKVFKI